MRHFVLKWENNAPFVKQWEINAPFYLEMGELRGMIPIEALQFPQSYEANFKLKRTYHVKRERTRNRSEVSIN